jgi:hypothetical protein
MTRTKKQITKQMMAQNNKTAIRNATYVREYLKTHSCVDCSETDPVVLEFDHVRGIKDIPIARAIRRQYSIDRLQREIDKCDVRCANCHRRKTADERHWFRGQ